MKQGIDLHKAASATEMLDDFIGCVSEGWDLAADNIVLVPTRQTAALLRLRIAERVGICAGIDFMTPEEFLTHLRRQRQIELHPTSSDTGDPWSEEGLGWRILALAPALADKEGFAGEGGLGRWLALGEFDDAADDSAREQRREDVCRKAFEDAARSDEVRKAALRASLAYGLRDIPTGPRWTKGRRTVKKGKLGKGITAGLAISPRLLVDCVLICMGDGCIPNVGESPSTDIETWAQAAASGIARSVTTWAESHEVLKDDVRAAFVVNGGERVEGALWAAIDQGDEPGAPDSRRPLAQDLAEKVTAALRSATAWDPDGLARAIVQACAPSFEPAATDDAVDLRMRRARRLPWARSTARLFLSYARQVPDQLATWATDPSRAPDLEAGPAHTWQRTLWQALCDDAAENESDPDPARFALSPEGGVLARVAEAGVYMYGCTYLSPALLKVLAALPAGSVHIFALDAPSYDLSDRNGQKDRGQGGQASQCNHDAPDNKAGRTLRQWGRQGRQLLESLGSAEDDSVEHHGARPAEKTSDRQTTKVHAHACMGASRQVDVACDLVAQAAKELHDKRGIPYEDIPERILIVTPDMATYSPLVTAAFQSGAESHGTPDGSSGDVARERQHPVKRLQLWPSHTYLSDSNEPWQFLTRVLELAQGRAEFSCVASILRLSGVQRAMGVDAEAVEDILQVVRESGAHWGWSPASPRHRAVTHDGVPTWMAVLRRLARGFALDERCAAEGRERHEVRDGFATPEALPPVSGLTSTTAIAAARMVGYVERLWAVAERIAPYDDVAAVSHLLSWWQETLIGLVDDSDEALFAACDQAGRSDLAHMVAWLSQLGQGAGKASEGIHLTLDEMRTLLAAQEGGVRVPRNAVARHVCLCGVDEPCGIPFDRVILLGITDTNFPGAVAPSGDDALVWERTGDGTLRLRPEAPELESPARTAQQCLVDLIRSAERVDIVFDGHDIKTGAALDEPVGIAELLAALGCPTTDHPLLPFAWPKPQQADCAGKDTADNTDEPFRTFDPRATEAFEAYERGQAERISDMAPSVRLGSFDRSRIDETTGHRQIELESLLGFFESPAKTFVRRRLGIPLDGIERVDPDITTITGLTPLEKARAAEEMLLYAAEPDGPFTSRELDDAWDQRISRGEYAPRMLTGPTIDSLDALLRRAQYCLAQDGMLGHGLARWDSIDINIGLDDGLVLRGRIDTVAERSPVVVSTSADYGDAKSRKTLRTGIVAAACLLAEDCARARGTGGRGIGTGNGGVMAYRMMGPKNANNPSPKSPFMGFWISDDDRRRARAWLGCLARIYAVGQQVPLPLPQGCAHAYAIPEKPRPKGAQDPDEPKPHSALGPAPSDYDLPYYQLLWGEDWQVRALDAEAPEGVLDYVFGGKQDKVREGRLKHGRKPPKSLFDYLALAVWGPFAPDGFIAERKPKL